VKIVLGAGNVVARNLNLGRTVFHHLVTPNCSTKISNGIWGTERRCKESTDGEFSAHSESDRCTYPIGRQGRCGEVSMKEEQSGRYKSMSS
jgi:hypothetical protein